MGIRQRRSAVLLSFLVLTAGCGHIDSGAERQAEDTASRVGREMTILATRDWTAMDLVRQVDDPSVTFLQASGRMRDGDVVIVARIFAEVEPSGWSDGSKATLCFEYRLDAHGRDATEPDEIDCPDVDPLAIPSPSPEPSVPPGTVERLTAELEALDGRVDERSVRAAAEAAVGEPLVSIEVDTVDGWIGVAVKAGSDCHFARVRGRSTEVWVPPRVVVQPGELTCGADTAARGLAKRPPH